MEEKHYLIQLRFNKETLDNWVGGKIQVLLQCPHLINFQIIEECWSGANKFV